jgi:hypothetical protein
LAQQPVDECPAQAPVRLAQMTLAAKTAALRHAGQLGVSFFRTFSSFYLILSLILTFFLISLASRATKGKQTDSKAGTGGKD